MDFSVFIPGKIIFIG